MHSSYSWLVISQTIKNPEEPTLTFCASRDIALSFPQWVHSYDKAALSGCRHWGVTKQCSVKVDKTLLCFSQTGLPSAQPLPPAEAPLGVWLDLRKLGPEDLIWRSGGSINVSRKGTKGRKQNSWSGSPPRTRFEMRYWIISPQPSKLTTPESWYYD